MSPVKGQKNYGKLLNSLNFTIPHLPKVPRAPDAYSNRDLVDVYMAKRRLELVHLLPEFDIESLRYASHIDTTFEQLPNIDKKLLSSLMANGYVGVINELISLRRDEEQLLSQSESSGREMSFTEDPIRLKELVKGLISCAEAEKTDDVPEKVRVRQEVGEKMILLGDFWLARKLFMKTFLYLEYYDCDDLDKMRVELWCLLSYVCIYYEDSQQIGYDLPSKCLKLARQVCREKGEGWHMRKTVMNIFIPKAINVYGLKNEWIEVKVGYVSMYSVVTTLLHVLSVKKAKYWQTELQGLENLFLFEKDEPQKEVLKLVKNHIIETLTDALAFADEVGLYNVFIGTTLRRGLFFEEKGDLEKAMEDFNAMHVLSLNYDDKEALAMAMNRIGQNCKSTGKLTMALDYFVHEHEISSEHDFKELKADALQDLSLVLLEEGLTWQADECISQAQELFHKTKKPDTPNNLDELSWAMMGVTRGMHLWGMFSTLIRSQEKSKIDAIYEWKMSRKLFPIASMPQKWYKTEKREDFDKQYKDCMPSEKTSRKSKRKTQKGGGVLSGVQFSEANQEETGVDSNSPSTTSPPNPNRRFFEFNASEVKKRPTVWLKQKGYSDLFSFMNASEKPRDLLTLPMEGGVDWAHNLGKTLSEMKMTEEGDEHHNFMEKRKTDAKKRQSRLEDSMHFEARRVTFGRKSIGDWMKHDFRAKLMKKKEKGEERFKKLMDPNMNMGERMIALLEDMQDVAGLELDKERDDPDEVRMIGRGRMFNEEEDESEDSELVMRKSKIPSGLLEELKNFDETQLGF